MVYTFPSWEDEIKDAALPYMDAIVQIYDPNTTSATDYVPEDDTGGVATPTLLWEGAARIQQVKAPVNQSTEYQWAVGRNYRFQCNYDEGLSAIFIRKGLMIQVISAPRDSSLTKMHYQVVTATNSDHRAVRTIECITDGLEHPALFAGDGGPGLYPINPAGDGRQSVYPISFGG